MRALAGALALVERGDDRAIQRHRAGMVAHAGDRTRRRGVYLRAHQIHQPRARPIGVAVEAGLVGLLALFAVAGERRIDQPRIERRKLRPGDAEPAAHRRRKIGDEDVGFHGEPVQHRLAFRLREVERQAALVAGFQEPGEIVLAARIARQVRQIAIGIARARRLDLDDAGAEIRQHGRGRGRSDEARAVQYLEAFEDAVFHNEFAPVTFCHFVRVLELVPRTSEVRRHLTHVGQRMQRRFFLPLPALCGGETSKARSETVAPRFAVGEFPPLPASAGRGLGKPLARKIEIHARLEADLGCLSSPFEKNISVLFRPKSPAFSAYPVPARGACRPSRNVGRGERWARRVTRQVTLARTAKSCGPDARIAGVKSLRG